MTSWIRVQPKKLVEEAKATGEARTIPLETVGRLADGTEVSRFTFTWSIKARTKRG
jgi:hypothetical protein